LRSPKSVTSLGSEDTHSYEHWCIVQHCLLFRYRRVILESPFTPRQLTSHMSKDFPTNNSSTKSRGFEAQLHINHRATTGLKPRPLPLAPHKREEAVCISQPLFFSFLLQFYQKSEFCQIPSHLFSCVINVVIGTIIQGNKHFLTTQLMPQHALQFVQTGFYVTLSPQLKTKHKSESVILKTSHTIFSNTWRISADKR